MKKQNYGTAILQAFEHLLEAYPDVFVIGQGLWSPWYVGNSMTNLERKFGKHRVLDTPVSELACTGAAVGASLCGARPIVVNPRMDFMLYAMDPIVNQAAKWSSMFAGQARACLTIRAIINRGGEQGAQHSQALHSWFAHVPGLRVVMPYSVSDARDLLISSVLCDDPVMYIDDRWLYETEAQLSPVMECSLSSIGPSVLEEGKDISVVGCGHSVHLARLAIPSIKKLGISLELIDLRVLNPLDIGRIVKSVEKTGRLLVVDPGTKTSGFAGEVIASVIEKVSLTKFRANPQRLTLPDFPAPTATTLEQNYYYTSEDIASKIIGMVTL